MSSAPKAQSSAEEIRKAVGDLSAISVFHNQTFVAIFKRSAVTSSGIHLPDQVLKEDEFQGKVGLVLKKGPLAFKDDARNDFGGVDVEEGDWVIFRVSDGFPLKWNGVMCRFLEDVHIKGTVADPLSVY